MTSYLNTNLKTTLLYQVLPWILPKRILDSVLLLTDIENSCKVKTLRFLLNSIIRFHHQNLQKSQNAAEDRVILHNIQIQNVHLTSQLAELQRSLNSLAHQCRLQQEDHFELERRLMEFKFGKDPLMMSSDSIFENCSVGSLSIDMNNIELNTLSFK